MSATVSRNPSGKYFVSLCCTNVSIDALPSNGKSIGIDLGIKDFAVSSGGFTYQNHKYLASNQKKLAKLQRQLSRKTKGSKRRDKAKQKVAQLHERIANQRKDMLHKLSTKLIRENDIIYMEDLAVKNMIQNHKLAKSIADASWGEFRRQLTQRIWLFENGRVQIVGLHIIGMSMQRRISLQKDFACWHKLNFYGRAGHAQTDTLRETM